MFGCGQSTERRRGCAEVPARDAITITTIITIIITKMNITIIITIITITITMITIIIAICITIIITSLALRSDGPGARSHV